MRASMVCCSDESMDIKSTVFLSDTPVNHYPAKCNTCSFPDIDNIPYPYYLIKKKIFSGIEIHLADLGNLLVSSRVKGIIEQLFPGQCLFHSTFIEGTLIHTDWWLAVIKIKIVSGEVKDEIPRCHCCGTPLYAHPGTQYKYWYFDVDIEYDIVKSENWHSMSTKNWLDSWISRDTFLSVRFIELLKRLKVKGIDQYFYSKNKKLLDEEKKWVNNVLLSLNEDLITPKVKHIAREEIEWLKEIITQFNSIEIKGEFTSKFKIKSNEIIDTLSCISKNILLDNEKEIELVPLKDWALNIGINSTQLKFISFCFDPYGNSWAFDATDSDLSIYIYNHEYNDYELIHSTIIEFLKTFWLK